MAGLSAPPGLYHSVLLLLCLNTMKGLMLEAKPFTPCAVLVIKFSPPLALTTSKNMINGSSFSGCTVPVVVKTS